MRLQTMYVPPVGGSERSRFALVVDQVDRGDDDVGYEEGVDRLWRFAEACGAAAVLVTPDTVEIPEVAPEPPATTPEPVRLPVHIPRLDLEGLRTAWQAFDRPGRSL